MTNSGDIRWRYQELEEAKSSSHCNWMRDTATRFDFYRQNNATLFDNLFHELNATLFWLKIWDISIPISVCHKTCTGSFVRNTFQNVYLKCTRRYDWWTDEHVGNTFPKYGIFFRIGENFKNNDSNLWVEVAVKVALLFLNCSRSLFLAVKI
jgi:hypothetical protein